MEVVIPSKRNITTRYTKNTSSFIPCYFADTRFITVAEHFVMTFNVDEKKQKQFETDLKVYQENDKNIVYINETGFEQLNLRPRGYAPVRQKCCFQRS